MEGQGVNVKALRRFMSLSGRRCALDIRIAPNNKTCGSSILNNLYKAAPRWKYVEITLKISTPRGDAFYDKLRDALLSADSLSCLALKIKGYGDYRKELRAASAKPFVVPNLRHLALSGYGNNLHWVAPKLETLSFNGQSISDYCLTPDILQDLCNAVPTITHLSFLKTPVIESKIPLGALKVKSPAQAVLKKLTVLDTPLSNIHWEIAESCEALSLLELSFAFLFQVRQPESFNTLSIARLLYIEAASFRGFGFVLSMQEDAMMRELRLEGLSGNWEELVPRKLKLDPSPWLSALTVVEDLHFCLMRGFDAVEMRRWYDGFVRTIEMLSSGRDETRELYCPRLSSLTISWEVLPRSTPFCQRIFQAILQFALHCDSAHEGSSKVYHGAANARAGCRISLIEWDGERADLHNATPAMVIAAI